MADLPEEALGRGAPASAECKRERSDSDSSADEPAAKRAAVEGDRAAAAPASPVSGDGVALSGFADDVLVAGSPSAQPGEVVPADFPMLRTLRGQLRAAAAMFRDGEVRAYFYELPYPGCTQVPKKSTLAFYAVRNGLRPGIYSIWDQTATYPGRQCALAQAMDFLEGDGTAASGLEAIEHSRPAGLKCPWE
eukprot:tig00021015_g17150.t1